jgi:hypothetical protein
VATNLHKGRPNTILYHLRINMKKRISREREVGNEREEERRNRKKRKAFEIDWL